MVEPASSQNPDSSEDRQPAAGARRPLRNLDSADIFRGDAEITISHNGEIYRLRVTKNGKLILHK